ncbi:outer membrane lipoprotein-sorting protein [Sulfurimonas sp. C5]|uniref:outer membrane lipoprotein-sorting protein n=1 Tax=Sulfurimonas sp. C5 TaxID=3036947 RepID=UPI00245857D7|nr:outer membrane lipoprotein-sorting protein [Sulfurimonas sp. C5]MDH4944527.1 outer membrane lipoprotein-sorting protein [Sulfurimonas sp. C5]
MIKKLGLISLLAFTALVHADDKARAIAQAVYDRDDGKTIIQDMKMILIDKNSNQRIRSIKTFGKDFGKDDYKIMFFKTPADVKDTAFLTYDYDDASKDDDQWLYLPALKKVKRIPTSDKSSSFMGSDFSYYDMTKRSVEDYTYKILKHVDVRGHDTTMVESIPVNDDVVEESGYVKTIGLVREDIDMVVRSIGFLKNGETKYLDVTKMHKQDGVWVIDEMVMTTKQGKTTLHQTILQFSNIEVNKPIDDDVFTTRRLEKGL